MANFETHLTIATTGSGLLSIAYLGAGIANPAEAVGFWLAGTLGGILPDIDADHSTAVKSIFTLMGALLASLVMISQASSYSIFELWIIGGATFAIVRYPLLNIFYRFTVHRGIFHSILTGAFFWFLATATCWHIFDLEATLSWTFGFFIFAGFIIHLSLDEIFSVDLMGTNIKRSFGTALELFDYSNIKTSGIMLGFVVGIFFLTPDIDSAGMVFFNGYSLGDIVDSFWPSGSLFF